MVSNGYKLVSMSVGDWGGDRFNATLGLGGGRLQTDQHSVPSKFLFPDFWGYRRLALYPVYGIVLFASDVIEFWV